MGDRTVSQESSSTMGSTEPSAENRACGRMGAGPEIAQAGVYRVSSDVDFIAGEVVVRDGGRAKRR